MDKAFLCAFFCNFALTAAKGHGHIMERPYRTTIMKNAIRILLPLLLLCAAPAASVKAQVIRLNTGWEFQRIDTDRKEVAAKNQGSDWDSQYNIEHLDAQDHELSVPADTLRAEQGRLSAGDWQPVSLPHTPRLEPLVVQQQWQGVCYYRRRLHISGQELKQRTWIEFEGAMHLADLWVNGSHAAQHAGGYTPFVTDITALLHAGDNELLVRLDNRNNALIPPGKPIEGLDFNYYGGLYRDARLIRKNALHITHPIMAGEVAGGGIFVTYPQVSDREATVEVKTHVANTLGTPRQVTVRHTLYEWSRQDGRGRKVTRTESALGIGAKAAGYAHSSLKVSRPRLWSPDAPMLYILRTEVLDGNSVADAEETRIGIRRIEFTKEHGCLINGRPYRLEGSNRHQEYPYVGYALSDQAHYRDMWQIRDNGFNIVRLGHYPQDPAVLDACDELGLLAIEPIPGWQFFNSAQGFVERTYRDVRDLIRRDRNHPSIIMWETTLNESNPPRYWKDQAVMTAHEEYPGDQCHTSGDTYGYDGFDVCYNDWEDGFNRPNHTEKASFIREYYDYEFGGHYSTTRVGRGDGDRALMQNAWNAQWSHNRYRAYYPHTAGQAVWSMHDYNRGCADNICLSGVADIFRLPKFSLHYFRTQVAAGSPTPSGAMPHEVFACTHWLPGSSDTVMVYGNVEEVALLLNGREVARRKADGGPATAGYVSAPDGGNADNIDFPPFTFYGIRWEPGELKAVGYRDGRAVAEHTVRTPGQPASLGIDYLRSGLEASRNDLLLMYVSLVDAQGTACFGENGRKVSLEVLQGGELRSPATVEAEAGIATFAVATADARRLRLRATSGYLEQTHSLKLKEAALYR